MPSRIAELIEKQRITTVFQPMAAMPSQELWAHEALSRGTSEAGPMPPAEMFALAAQLDLEPALDLLCLETAIRSASRAGLHGRLFINVSPHTLMAHADLGATLARICEQHVLPASRCVLELTEQTLLQDYARIRESLAGIRDHGFGIAIDDFGSGFSGLRTWSELRPDYVKVDQYFVQGIDRDPIKMEFVRSIVDMARAIGSRVIAEGVESLGECLELACIGVDALQGFYIGRPDSAPRPPDAVLLPADVDLTAGGTTTAADLLTTRRAVPPSMPVLEAVTLFRDEPGIDAVPVIREDGCPVGMLYRDDVMTLYSKPFHPEVYNRKPVTSVMDSQPIQVEARLRLEQVGRLVTHDRRSELPSSFIIVRDGRYLGLGHTIDLLRTITKHQVRQATLLNPLTTLPGNVPIRECVTRHLAENRRFWLCYIDIDHFKPYNDFYGFAKGDHVLLHLAEHARRSACPRVDFVGHVGGDDFVLVMRSPDWSERIHRIVREFGGAVQGFYDAEHTRLGGIETRDREGRMRRFPLLTLSVAVLDSSIVTDAGTDALFDRLQTLKREAKHRAGDALVVETSTRDDVAA